MRCPFVSFYLGVKFCPFLWNTKVPCKDRLTCSCALTENLGYRDDVCVENK